MAIWAVGDHAGEIRETDRGEIEFAIKESGYPYELRDLTLAQLGALALKRGVDWYAFSKPEALALARTRGEMNGDAN